MAKPKTVHVCSECGGKSPRWQGQCPHCKVWNTLVESVVEPEAPVAKRFAAAFGADVNGFRLGHQAPAPRTDTGTRGASAQKSS